MALIPPFYFNCVVALGKREGKIVSNYLTYTDTAVSKQTGQSRVVFEENSGLAVIIPVDYVLETIDTCFATAKIKETICQ